MCLIKIRGLFCDNPLLFFIFSTFDEISLYIIRDTFSVYFFQKERYNVIVKL